MITFKFTQKHTHNIAGQRGQLQYTEGRRSGPQDGGGFPCPILEYWSMGCCGIGTFHNTGSLQYLTKEELDAFFDWLDQQVGPAGYTPQEWLFSLAEYQHGLLPHLINHPKVKQIDSFLNKSHGPSRIFIYRYSGQKDFS